MELTDKKYKESEVGLIPINWEVKTLGACLTRNPDYGINAPAVPYSDSLPTYIRITDISDDGRFNKSGKVSVNDIQSSNFYLEVGDIVLARTGASVGKSYCYDYNDGALVFAGFLIRIKPDQDFLNPKYLKFFLQSNFYLNWVKENSMRSGQPGINSNEYSRLPIPIPSKSEQTAIATALSDTDALIENLEKLIAKIRNIKQGVMQELLTGRKRLAGFNGEWGIRKLGDLAEMYSGGTPLTTNDSFYNGDIPWVVIADMTKSGKYIYKTEKTITETGLQNSSAKLFKKGVILFAMYASIGKCTIAQMDTACNQAILGVSTKLIDTEFLYYYLSYNESKFIRMGQTGTQSNLNKEIVQELKIPFPQRNEQIEIAGFLSSIDNEIDGLEQKLRKSQMIKQGMMQTLITGKIRLA